MNASADPRPGKTEIRLSIVVMVILAAVGIGIFMRQYRLNPAVVAMRPAAQTLPAAVVENASLVPVGSGLVAFSPPERFRPETLYEKIDGRADLYLSSGFVSLSTQRFTMDNAAGNWVELFVYDMATPENAFSVFSMQRRDGARPDGIVPNAYRTENALFMTRSHFYLEIIGTDASKGLQQAMGMLARAFVRTHGGRTVGGATGLDLFPGEGRQAGSFQLIAANAFGYEPLDRIYSCEYRIGGARMTAFVSERQSREAATALAGNYRKLLLSYGATAVDTPEPVDGAAVLKLFDTYEIVFGMGRYLAGVHEAKDLKAAKTLARRVDEHLKGVASDRTLHQSP